MAEEAITTDSTVRPLIRRQKRARHIERAAASKAPSNKNNSYSPSNDKTGRRNILVGFQQTLAIEHRFYLHLYLFIYAKKINRTKLYGKNFRITPK